MKNKLTLIEDLGMIYATNKSKQKSRFGLYKCECGNIKKIRQISVSTNKTLSCGCLHKKAMRDFNYRHGFAGHRLYHTWINMMSRCYKHTNKRYEHYGAKGITVCEEWHNIKNFINDMDASYKSNLSLDRIDNKKGYYKENCRWTDITTQNQNTSILRKTNKSGFRGVSWHSKAKKWRVIINVNKKQKHLGFFDNAKDGALVYDKFVKDNNLEHSVNF